MIVKVSVIISKYLTNPYHEKEMERLPLQNFTANLVKHIMKEKGPIL